MQKMEITYSFYGSFIRSECKKFIQNVNGTNKEKFVIMLKTFTNREGKGFFGSMKIIVKIRGIRYAYVFF